MAGLDLPDTAAAGRVTLDLALAARVPVSAFASPTHPLSLAHGEGRLMEAVAEGRVLDSRDLALTYGLEGAGVQAAALSHAGERGGFVSMLIEPSARATADEIAPREPIFVLDTSGSMAGEPMDAGRRFMVPVAFGGSALLRGLAALPTDLPAAERARPFRAVAVEDVAATVRHLVTHAPDGPVVWDLMHPEPLTLGAAVDALREWLGTGRPPLALPRPILDLGAGLGDLAARLGWRPPVRSVTLAELRRGVDGDPSPWLAATGIVPRTLTSALAARPAGVQERWFARLFLLKPVWIVTLAAFWVLSGTIALFVSYLSAAGILLDAGFPAPLAHLSTLVSSLADIAVGLLILHRRTCRTGLVLGIAVSLFYMAGAAVLTPAMWVEPLGALVKTFPAIVLMLVALATLDER